MKKRKIAFVYKEYKVACTYTKSKGVPIFYNVHFEEQNPFPFTGSFTFSVINEEPIAADGRMQNIVLLIYQSIRTENSSDLS